MSPAWSRRAWLRGAAAGLGLAVAPALLGCGRRRDRQRVYLGVDPVPGVTGEGIRTLVADHLEALGGFTVLPWPPEGQPLSARSRATLLRVRPRLEGERLAFEAEASHPSGLQRPPVSVPPLPPAEAFARLAAGLPLGLPDLPPGILCPVQASAFRPLLEALAGEDDPRRGAELRTFSRTLARTHPDCATAQFLLANQLYNQLLLHPLEQEAQWSAFKAYRSGLAALPWHPRGLRGFTQLLADSGLHRDALSLLEEALQQRPAVPSLCHALAYVSRTSGLLDLARRALGEAGRRMDGKDAAHCENTWLYLGDLAAHRATCRLEGTGRDARVHFYLGYHALLRGDRAAAATAFRASAAVPGGWYGFEQLSEVFLLALDGRGTEAAGRLSAMAEQRAGLRAPDGEFTFKLAEAAAFLGQVDRALELGELAFTQGFGCTRWFEQSPLLAPVRATARWQVLWHHLRERQALLESRYTPRRFDL